MYRNNNDDSDSEIEVPERNVTDGSDRKSLHTSAKKNKKVRFYDDEKEQIAKPKHIEPVRDMSQLRLISPSVNLLVGKPKRGKSHLLKYLIYYYTIGDAPDENKYQWLVVFTGSKFNNDFKGMIPDRSVIEMNRNTYEQLLSGYLEKLNL
jgi:hypothetical protein